MFDKLPVLEQVSGIIRAPQITKKEIFAKIFWKVNLKMLTILAKNAFLDGWLGQECASADRRNSYRNPNGK